MITPPETRQRLQALHECATKGLWHVKRGPHALDAIQNQYGLEIAAVSPTGVKNPQANGDLIAESRNALPGLLADVEALSTAEREIAERVICTQRDMARLEAATKERDAARAALAGMREWAQGCLGQIVRPSPLSPQGAKLVLAELDRLERSR